MPRRGNLPTAPTLLVASSGGHLMELHELRSRMELDGSVHWATFDTEQSRSLLAGERVHYVAYNGPREAGGVVTNTARAAALLRRERYGRVISTGAGIALSFLPAARLLGARCHYIESAARTDRPSLTARVLERVPGIRMYSQSADLRRRRWHTAGSVFDVFAAQVGPPPARLRRVVVTVGTMTFGFRRLVERLSTLLGPDDDVLWQTGGTDVTGLGIDARPFLASQELQREIAGADLVISHAGVGSALAALEAGRCPVLVPRLEAHGEHVDDHQLLIAAELARRGLALTADPESITRELLLAAAGNRITRVADPPVFRLAQ